MAILRALVSGVVLVSCGSSDPTQSIHLPAAQALWARTYADDGINQNVSFRSDSAQTRVATDGNVLAIVGDIVGISDGPLANTGLGSGLVALLDAATGAPLFEQVISAQPKGGYALVEGLTTAVVPDGVIVAGSIFGTLTLGTEVADGPGGYNGAFLAKFDRTGQVMWAKFPGSGGISQVRADAAGNVYIVGSVSGQFDFGAGAFPDVSEYGTGMTHLFIAKLDPSGTQVFVDAYAVTRVEGITASGSSSAQGLALDASGNATWFGSFAGTVDLGNGAMTSARNVPGYSPDTFLARTSATGDVGWTRDLGSTQISDIAVDPSGATVLVGSCNQPVYLGPGEVPCAEGNGFVTKLDDAAIVHHGSPEYFTEIVPSPQVRFSGTDGGSAVNESGAGLVDVLGVAVDVDGNAFVAGELAGDLAIGDASVPWTSGISDRVSIAGNWTSDALLAGFDSSGRPFWAQGFGDTDYQVGQSLAVDTAGHVFAIGWLGGTVTFGTNVSVTAQKSSDVFVAAFSP